MLKKSLLGIVIFGALCGCDRSQSTSASAAPDEAASIPEEPSSPPREVKISRDQIEPKDTFFPLAPISAESVRACRTAALAFDTNRRLEMAEKVVATCEADANKDATHDCTMYAVRISSAASKFIDQMKMIEENNPGWAGMSEAIRWHKEEAKKFAAKCTS